MTGTALTEAEEFHKIYKLEVVPIPTNQPMIRKDESDLIYKTEEGKFKAVVDEIAERTAKGQPVLVGTTSIEKSERLGRLLEKRGIQHSILNAKQHEREASIVADAGQRNVVTIATNMAGRGTDIELGKGVSDVGGLYIIGTERHESRRIDNQLRGRSGRQGDPGESRFFLSFEDDLMRVFGGERMSGIMDRLRIDEDTPIESRMVSRQIEGAQSRVEGHNFDTRRHVVEYDDVMNKQREVIYGERRKILEGTDTRHNVLSMVEHVLDAEIPTYAEGRHREAWDIDGLWTRLREYAELPPFDEIDVDTLGNSVEELRETLLNEFIALYEEREQKYGDELFRRVEQQVMLSVIDQRWRNYLTDMDRLREGVGLVSYGQKDPLIEYKQEAFSAFQDLTAEIQHDIVRLLFHVQIQVQQPAEQEPAPVATEEEGAPPAGRADRPGDGGAADADQPPPARPAAARASGALARVATDTPAQRPATPPVLPVLPGGRPAVRNVVERSAEGEHSAGGGNGAGNGRGAMPSGRAKVGRNDPCPCGSGLKYKKCHGSVAAQG